MLKNIFFALVLCLIATANSTTHTHRFFIYEVTTTAASELWSLDLDSHTKNLIYSVDHQKAYGIADFKLNDDQTRVLVSVNVADPNGGIFPIMDSIQIVNLAQNGQSTGSQEVFRRDPGVRTISQLNWALHFFYKDKIVYSTEEPGGSSALWVYDPADQTTSKVFAGETIFGQFNTIDVYNLGATGNYRNHRFYFASFPRCQNCPGKAFYLDLETLALTEMTDLPDRSDEGELTQYIADEYSDNDWVLYTRCRGKDGYGVYYFNVATKETGRMWHATNGTACKFGGTDFARIENGRAFFNTVRGYGVFDLNTHKLVQFNEVAAINSNATLGYTLDAQGKHALADFSTGAMTPTLTRLPNKETALPAWIGHLWNRKQTIGLYAKQTAAGLENTLWAFPVSASEPPVQLGTFVSDDWECKVDQFRQSVICSTGLDAAEYPAP